jgi:hypothetical protein
MSAMRKVLLAAALVGGIGAGSGAVQAGTIETACLRSDRGGVTRSLCNCIQRVADATLNRGDQRLASGFFADPHRAQEVRQSDRQSDAAFWQRYKAFGATAENYCR